MAATSSTTVTYHRGATTISGVAAVVGTKLFKVSLDYGFFKYITSRDFLILASAMTALGEPQDGDEIRETGGDGTVRIYRVMSPAGEPHWVWSDEYQNTYRIHTKYVKDVA
jgi:hypothetical protein